MKQLYPLNRVTKVFTILSVLILTVISAVAQCPAGAVSPTHNSVYGNATIVCVSGTFTQTITLNSGAELVIAPTGVFTGRLTAKAGSVITIQAGGTFTPSNLVNFAGKIVNSGTANLGNNSGIADGAVIENKGVMNFNNNANYFGKNTELKNLEKATMNVNYNFQFPSNGTFSNDGVLFTKNLTISSNSVFRNRGKAYVIGNLSLDGKVINDYLMVIKGTTSKQASDSLINYNMMVFDGNANFNGGVRNEGLMWFTSGQTKFHNGGLVQNNPGSLIRINSASFYNNATIQATGGMYSAIIPVQSDGSIRGLNATKTLTTNFSASQISNNAWSPASNSNLNGIPTASFQLFDTLNYVGAWAQPAAPYGQTSMLPIVLESFTASAQQSAVIINWATSTEVNGEYMVLQYSTNGTTYTDIHKVHSTGAVTGSKYQYKHQQPATGTNYYRIKMISADEGVKYSSVATVKISGSVAASQMHVFPNPFSNQLQVKYTTSTRGTVSIRLISAEGKVVLNKLSNNEPAGVQTVNITTPAGLKPGIYFLEVSTAEGTTQQKLLKQ